MLLEWVHLICEKDFGLLVKLLTTDPFVISLLFFTIKLDSQIMCAYSIQHNPALRLYWYIEGEKSYQKSSRS